MTRLRQQTQLLAAQNGLGTARSPKLVESAGTVRLHGVFGNEKLRGDLAIAQAAGNQGENFEFARRDAKALLPGRIRSEGSRIGSEWGGRLRSNKHFPHH